MTEDKIIYNLAKDLKISPDRLVAESWEIIILKELFSSPFSKFLIFKGGTALRLAYNSPRFSEDLDFSLIKTFPFKEFVVFLKKIIKKYKELSISDLKEKYYTYFALIKIKEPFLKLPFSIKIEISKRKIAKNFQQTLKVLTSPTSSLEVMANIVTLQQIRKDKIQAIRTRQKPRDLFDLWYISERLKKPMPKITSKMSGQKIKQELLQFLPRDYQQVVNFLIENYGKTTRKIRRNK